MPTSLKWLAGILLALIAAVIVLALLPNWNALRDPIERRVYDKTGRELVIGGDLKVRLGWPGLRVSVADARFANPRWAKRPQMVTVENARFALLVPPLLRGRLVLDDVRVDDADVNLEKRADGRRNWLLDLQQRDERVSVRIRRLTVTDGRVEYLEPAADTALRAAVSTRPARDPLPLRFRVEGRYRGEPMQAQGRGGSVLGLRDTEAPYRFALNGKLGPTQMRAAGQVTELMMLGAVDLQIGIQGRSLDDLYPYTGVVLPDTPPYRTSGHLQRTGNVWRYEKFSARIGSSDLAGTLQVDAGRTRPLLKANLQAQRLDLADLGPVIGVDDRDRPEGAGGGVLPSEPFRTERWKRMDADVRLDATAIRGPEMLPLDDLSTHLQLRDGVLTLSPLKVDVAGGTLSGSVQLDGSQPAIRADVDLKARGLKLTRLVPEADIEQASLGQINGDVDLAGTGRSVAQMLGEANGRVAAVIDGGTVSRFMMEAVSLHLLDMLQLKLTGDEVMTIRCGVAEFGVKDGIMRSDILVLDTDLIRVDGSGTINLERERLDLRLVPRTRKLSFFAAPTPINIEGRFANPEVDLAKGPLAARALGALALGAINPALAAVALIDTSSAVDSECRKWIAEARRPG